MKISEIHFSCIFLRSEKATIFAPDLLRKPPYSASARNEKALILL